MQAENLVLLEGAESLSKGDFDKVALEDGCLVLEQVGSGYVFCGCYTAKPMRMPAFRKMVASWNADTPEGTVVEVQARVFVQGQWSQWLSFGRWSPFIKRSSFPEKGTLADMDTDTLVVHSEQGAQRAQLRVYLYTDSETVSPRVRLLGLTVRPLQWRQQEGTPFERELYLPAYSQLNRDPAIGNVMCSAVTITALINRWGEDALPEEVAHACYDNAYHGFGNWAFSTAVAGSFGYTAYVAYLDLAGLRREIRNGYSVGVSVRYTNDPELAEKEGLPLLDGAPGTTHGHLMAVHGFAVKDGVEYALVNDSNVSGDGVAARRYRLDQFMRAWEGRIAYIVHPKQKGAGQDRPRRIGAQLRPGTLEGEFMLEVKEKPCVLPKNFLNDGEHDCGTLAYTLQDGVAYATTAHKCFNYLKVTENGGIRLPSSALDSGARVSVYAIDGLGNMLVAEKKGSRVEAAEQPAT